MPSNDLIRNFGLFFYLNLLGIEVSNDLCVLEKNHGCLERFEIKNEVERS